MKKVYIETLGCSKNVVDSEQMLGILDEEYLLVEDAIDAEIIIVNTCSFIHDAKEESVDMILELAKYKQEGQLRYLIVTGCLSQRYPQELIDEIPEIDAVIGTGNFFKVNEVLNALESGTKEKMFIESVDLMIPETLPRIITTPQHYAYLKIAEGCDNRCTYCIIPKLRGKYRSRLLEDILDEARDLVAMGVKEFIVIAQDTSRYGMDLYGKPSLDVLLRALNAIEGIVWIRVHYLYPDVVEDHLLEAFFECEKVIPYFDIPIQHASNAVLKRMNRHTSNEDIAQLVKKIRSFNKESVIRTTVIVGFPGETETDFETLLAFIEDIKFDRLGAFSYSDEEGTPAFKLPNKVEQELILERQSILMEKQMHISEALFASKIGRIYDVVIEEVAEVGKIYVGRTPYDAPDIDGVVYVHVDTELELGQFCKVKITDSLEYDMIGELYNEIKHS